MVSILHWVIRNLKLANGPCPQEAQSFGNVAHWVGTTVSIAARASYGKLEMLTNILQSTEEPNHKKLSNLKCQEVKL